MAANERLRRRLELRSSNAAVPHKSKQKELTKPGKGNRRAQKRKAIKEGE